MTLVEAMDLIEAAHQRGELAPGTHLQRRRSHESGKAGWQLSQGFSSEWFPTIQAVAKELGITKPTPTEED